MERDNKIIIFLSWHNSLPGLIKNLYWGIPYQKYFICRNHIKPPRLFDNNLMTKSNSFSFNSDIEVIQKIKSLNATHVIVWNGDFDDEERGHQPIILNELKKFTKIIYCEHGWFPQKGIFVIDRKGTNGGSEHVEKNIIDENINLNLIRIKQNEYIKDIKKPDANNYLFIPLQIKTDTQIVKYSPYFKDMESFIKHIVMLFQDKLIIIKPHPKDSIINKQNILKECQKYTNTQYTESLNSISWGYYSNGIIAINSTIINEMLLFHKPIMTYGINYFSNKGVTYEVTSENIEEQRNFLNYKINESNINKYLTSLLNLQFNSGNPDIIKTLKYFE